MKKFFILACLPIALYSCSNQQEKAAENEDNTTTTETATATAAPSLTKVWETDDVLTTCESTLYDKQNNIIYVSNISGSPTEKDGNGFISRIRPDGSIEELNWVTGLNAPKGMALLNNKLYVTDIDELVEINVSDRKIANKYPVQGATFLNDAASDGNNVFFTDMNTGKVHKLENGKVQTVAEGLERINGLAFHNGQMYFLDGKGLRTIDNGQEKAINETVTGGDGLVIIDDNTFIASRWQGEVYLIRDGEEQKLLDTKDQESNTADIDFIEDENLLLVPTFQKNKVVAYKLEY